MNNIGQKPVAGKENNRKNEPVILSYNFNSVSLHAQTPLFIQPKLFVNTSGDKYEQQADAVADKIMRMSDNEVLKQPFKISATTVQRKCAKCEKEGEEKKLHRKESNHSSQSFAPTIVSDVLNSSSGNPMDEATRSFMESRFNHDFSSVKIYDSNTASESANSINALAFTTGNRIVFNTNQYNPRSNEGKKLLAHELVHTIQQKRGQKDIQRACLPAADCVVPASTLENFVADTESKPENISKADKRKKACYKKPPLSTCTSYGHGAKAVALTSILSTNYKSRLGFVTGIYVDKDMPKEYGAVTYACNAFIPSKPGTTCTFVPDFLEVQAKQYVAGNISVGGETRQSWLANTIGTLAHETEHARFDAQAPIAKLGPKSCRFEDHESNLSEMAAHLSEMHVYYRAALAKPSKDRFKYFYKMFDYWIKNGSEDIAGIVKDLRCKCECADVDNYIAKTVESVAKTQKWDSNEAMMIHTELKDPRWNLKWPVNPPAAVNIMDLPTEKSAPFKMESQKPVFAICIKSD